MRIVINFTPSYSSSIETDFEYKFRGVLYSAIRDTHPLYHNSEIPAFTFSDVLPPTDVLDSSETYQIVVCSYNESVLDSISKSLSNEHIEIGDIKCKVLDIYKKNPKIGSSGSVQTETGVYCAIPNEKEYDTFWKPDEHSVSTFINIIETELDRRIDLLTEYDSSERDFSVFNSVEFNRMKARPYQIATDKTHTIITSKWKLSYNIQNQLHYTYIQMALSIGIGTKNSLGFGFLWM